MIDKLNMNLPPTKSRVNDNFGIWWVKREDGKYYIQQSSQTVQMFGHSVEGRKREVFSKRWQEIADKVISMHPEYKNLVDAIKGNFYELVNGECETYTHHFPWLNQDQDLIWIENQLMVILEDEKGPTLIAGSSIDVTEQISYNHSISKLEEANEQLELANQKAIDLAKFLVWRIDYNIHPKGDLFFANERYVQTLGLDRTSNGYLVLDDFMNSAYPDEEGEESLAKLLSYFYEAVENKRDHFYRVVVKHKNAKTGEPVFLEHNTKVEKRSDDGQLLVISGYIIDVTERIKMERQNLELSKENEVLYRSHSLAIKSGKVLIWYINSDEMVPGEFYGNDLMIDRLGLEPKENGLFSVEDFHNTICRDDKESVELANEYDYARLETAKKRDRFDKIILKQSNPKTGEIIYFEHNFEVESRYPDGSLKVRGGFLTDVTTEVQYRKRSEYLMKYDEMTGLQNRNSFEQFISSSDIPDEYALIIIDIDGLKFINDAFGHMKGDEAIKFTANRITEYFEETSTSFRIGGDEYAIISSIINTMELEQVLAHLKASLTNFYHMHNININMSYGFELVHNDKGFEEAFIEAENRMYRRKLNERNSRKSRTMETVLETLNQKTEETRAHAQRMGDYAIQLMKKIGYTRSSDFDDMELLCRVHDIGKITISEDILSKTGKLTNEEYLKIKKHSEAGYKIVRNIVESDDIAYGVLYHHERIDGKGYPFGLKGDEIPIYARIVSICDAYDVMVSGRPYSDKKTINAVIKELRANAGTQFDVQLVNYFIDIIQEENDS